MWYNKPGDIFEVTLKLILVYPPDSADLTFNLKSSKQLIKTVGGKGDNMFITF